MSKRGVVKRDIVGKRFNNLVVLDEYIQVKSNYKNCSKTKWLCKCDCGHKEFVYRDQILKSKTDYCTKCRPLGVRNSRLYHVYYGMKERCYNQNSPSYDTYGGRGIQICKEWSESYKNFCDWAMENGYSDDLTIDRIDPDGDYCPENCRWIPLSENSARANVGKHKNKSKLLYAYAISPDGVRVEITNISKFSREFGMNRSTVSSILHGRMKNKLNGWKFYSNKTTA